MLVSCRYCCTVGDFEGSRVFLRCLCAAVYSTVQATSEGGIARGFVSCIHSQVRVREYVCTYPRYVCVLSSIFVDVVKFAVAASSSNRETIVPRNLHSLIHKSCLMCSIRSPSLLSPQHVTVDTVQWPVRCASTRALSSLPRRLAARCLVPSTRPPRPETPATSFGTRSWPRARRGTAQ